ncbi:phospholipid scramblase 2 isoform X2 [Diprion similis]|uniref:phospholipid scramblase 2 isoform X2 n=1 Tax=Diprion similis TaxID=362088 RepID=UPI001EF8E9E4|nr:phospholipid scramblase 2 isoform X2 [Diprion similis]
MGDWQNPHQAGWNSGVQGMNMPPTVPLMTPPQPGIPLMQPGLPVQPGAVVQVPPGGWPMPNSSCPSGLEYLMALDRLMVDQQVELLEAFTGWETANKYVVKDPRGQVVYYVAEESHFCGRMCCGKYRPFNMRIVDVTMKEVISLHRPLQCSSCCFPCCLQEMEVCSNGVQIGSIAQNWNPIRPSFSICDASGDSVLSIKGPICMCSCFDIDFDVLSVDGEHKVGRISKKWSGFAREVFTDSDMFGISFPGDLDVKIKAVLLGACFLIDFMYFEGKSKAGQLG